MRMHSFKHYLVILTISALPFVSMFLTSSMPHTHDGPVHLARIASYYKELSYGQIPPRWASELNFGVGMPLFNFMYHVPYLVASIPLYFSLGLVASFKISLLMSFLLSGVGMFLFSKKLLGNVPRAYLVTLLYQFAPFHLVELVVRGSIGEAYTYSFLPFVLYGILLVIQSPTVKHILFTSVVTALLVLSHNAISLVSFFVAVVFALWFAPKMKNRYVSLLSLCMGLGFTAFYWLPAMLERKYTYGDLFMKDMYLAHFAPFINFFIPNFTNAAALQTGGITVYIGLVQSIVFVTAIYLIMTKKMKDILGRRIIFFVLFLIMGCFFFMQPISKEIWARIPTLRMFQFPWRLLSIVGLGTALLGGVVTFKHKQFNTTSCVFLSIITVLSTIVFWTPPLGFDKIIENDYWNYPLNTTYFGETDLIWSDGPASSYPETPFELISGKGQISNVNKKSTHHSFTIQAQTQVQILDNTQYFPGWRVFIDGNKTPIEFQDQNHRGRITFAIPAGIHQIQVVFGNSPTRTVGNIISIITIGFTLIAFVFAKKKRSLNTHS